MAGSAAARSPRTRPVMASGASPTKSLGELEVALQQEAQVRAVAAEKREERLSRGRLQRRSEHVSSLAGRAVAQPVDAGLGLVLVVRAQRVETVSLRGQRQNAGRCGVGDDQRS